MKWVEIFFKGADALVKIVESLKKLGEIFGRNDKKGGEGKQSKVYKAMTPEGKERVDGLKKALDAARNANNRPEAARVLGELSNVYAQEARLMENTPELIDEAKKISNTLRELSSKVATYQDAIPRGIERSQNNHTAEQVIVASNQHNLASANKVMIAENSNHAMYDLALKSFKANNGSEANATPLDLFNIMINHDVDPQMAKAVILSYNPSEKDLLEASIDKQIDASKTIKENSQGIALDNNTKSVAKQEQLVA